MWEVPKGAKARNQLYIVKREYKISTKSKIPGVWMQRYLFNYNLSEVLQVDRYHPSENLTLDRQKYPFQNFK